MRPVGEAFCEGIEKKNADRQWRQLQGEGIQLPRRDEKHHHYNQREKPRELQRQRTRRECALFRARVFAIVTKIGDAVHGHRCGARRHHRDDDPQNLA